MNVDTFFHWIGEQIGRAIRFIVDGLGWLFEHIQDFVDSFVQGLTGALGIDASLFSLLILIIGLAMLAAAVRALTRRAVLPTLLWSLLGVVVLSWLIH